MKKEDKVQVLEQLTKNFSEYKNLVFADVSDLTVAQTTELRKLCYKNGVKLQVAKNTFIKKALEKLNITNDELMSALKGPSSIMYAETVNGAAKLIKEFRRTSPKPILKAAYIEETVFIGDSSLDLLVNFKTKEDLLAELIGLLNSPVQNLIGALNSAGNKLSGVLETLGKKEE
jgi:large subunit ribosomal protein L10